jgi:hypothetical protein
LVTPITLADAIEQHRESGAGLSSYESYRRDARENGELVIGGKKVRAEKIKGKWHVDGEAFTAGVACAVEEQRRQREALNTADIDYEAHRLNPQGARLSWGSYRVSGGFHFLSSDYARIRQRSNGGWICNTCWQPASTENNAPECHTCSDWNGCGSDCTLSRVFCVPCGTSLDVGGTVGL